MKLIGCSPTLQCFDEALNLVDLKGIISQENCMCLREHISAAGKIQCKEGRRYSALYGTMEAISHNRKSWWQERREMEHTERRQHNDSMNQFKVELSDKSKSNSPTNEVLYNAVFAQSLSLKNVIQENVMPV